MQTTAGIPSMYLEPEGAEQTLFSNKCSFFFDLSGGSLKNPLKWLALFHLTQNIPRVEVATQGKCVQNI